MGDTYKILNPANGIKTAETIMFRGIAIAENEQTVPHGYVESMNNLTSFRLREMEPRAGQTIKTAYDHAVYSGKKTLSQMVVCEGPNLHVDPIRDNLTPIEPIDFMRPITIPSEAVGIMSGTCYLNTDMTVVAGVTLTLRMYAGGDVIATTSTNADGIFYFTGLESNFYHVTLSKTGFETQAVMLERKAGNVVLMCAELAAGEARITLSWGPLPLDLDLHLIGADPSGDPYHCYFDDDDITDEAQLDHDDTDAFGPETMSILRFNSGTYKVYVHDYSNRTLDDSDALHLSKARIDLFFPNDVNHTYTVPLQAGTLWKVIEIDGDSLDITVSGAMSYESNEENIS